MNPIIDILEYENEVREFESHDFSEDYDKFD